MIKIDFVLLRFILIDYLCFAIFLKFGKASKICKKCTDLIRFKRFEIISML